MLATVDSLVVFKRQPARVVRVAKKVELEGPLGTARVRLKDVTVLHPGPVDDVRTLRAPSVDPQDVWDVLDGQAAPLRDVAELAFGAFTPETALAVWHLVDDGTYFTLRADRVEPVPAEVLERRREAARRADAEARDWQAFLDGLREGRVTTRRLLADVEALAFGRATTSRVLAALERPQTPQAAHALLLDVGAWDAFVNPHPVRHGVVAHAPTLPTPSWLPDARVDLSHLDALAIDDADTAYPDDAISFERLAGGWRVWVHVADVAALVPAGSDLDGEARARGATLYLPEGVSPMLPRDVSHEVALGLTEASNALSVAVTLDEAFEPQRAEVLLTRVRVTRVSYEDAQARLDAGDALLTLLARFAAARRAAREAAGAILIDWPSVRVRVHDHAVRFEPEVRLESHRVVEEAMLLAGWGAAAWAAERHLALPFVTQHAPFTRPNGEGLALQFARRRASKRTTFAFTPAPHAGIGVNAYARVTSPLRRYEDLAAHQQLRAALLEERASSGRDALARVLVADAGANAVKAAQRDSTAHWTMVHLQALDAWEGDAHVVGRRGKRAVVFVPAFGLEVLMKLDEPVGSHVRVHLDRVDIPNLRATFRVVSSEAA
ncbi:RNB domain-containing ribonuclease [Deinococcus yavapaiensis]|uniref:Exoribonuclease-2 n=1 Tax=Deinococcus yavapaiensis KR-236 TaxID=694435 RepID=A0A318S4M5_9DEIO|nr:RNB domain-containing ribonuclease [Deinococcus yavapaiensis]PYE52018.1 exoribonuclease-2 [Deinococcus yavapaiensis KR-236]